VSMAANAGTKLQKVIANVERVLAIEWLVANQALSLRNAPTADFIQQLHTKFRKVVPTLNEDRALYEDIEKSIQFVKNIQLIP
jgi:histidine ammonia-lyase